MTEQIDQTFGDTWGFAIADQDGKLLNSHGRLMVWLHQGYENIYQSLPLANLQNEVNSSAIRTEPLILENVSFQIDGNTFHLDIEVCVSQEEDKIIITARNVAERMRRIYPDLARQRKEAIAQELYNVKLRKAKSTR